MASFKDLNTIANDATFQGRCMYALQVAAINVMAETKTTQDHNARADFARRILAANVPALIVTLSALTNSTLAAEASVAAISTDAGIPDSDIQFTINSIFNALAGLANN